MASEELSRTIGKSGESIWKNERGALLGLRWASLLGDCSSARCRKTAQRWRIRLLSRLQGRRPFNWRIPRVRGTWRSRRKRRPVRPVKRLAGKRPRWRGASRKMWINKKIYRKSELFFKLYSSGRPYGDVGSSFLYTDFGIIYNQMNIYKTIDSENEWW